MVQIMFMDLLFRSSGISKSKSSSLHSQGDGTSEAFVKQMKSCIQKQVNDHGFDWDLYLPTTAFEIRNNIAFSTKFTPSELMLGAKLSQPIDRFVESPLKSFVHKQAIDFAKRVKAKIDNSAKIVQQNLQKSRNDMKKEHVAFNLIGMDHGKSTPLLEITM